MNSAEFARMPLSSRHYRVDSAVTLSPGALEELVTLIATHSSNAPSEHSFGFAPRFGILASTPNGDIEVVVGEGGGYFNTFRVEGAPEGHYARDEIVDGFARLHAASSTTSK
ncbi:MAG: hypothetical protein P8R43_09805 [Planctomycetota bacterium]|nr:hypothetical protein [Planctomycetota bacterium]